MSAAAAETALVTGLTRDGEGVVRGGKTAFVAGALTLWVERRFVVRE